MCAKKTDPEKAGEKGSKSFSQRKAEEKKQLLEDLDKDDPELHKKDFIKFFSSSIMVKADGLRLIKKAEKAKKDKDTVGETIAHMELRMRMLQALRSDEIIDGKVWKGISVFWMIIFLDLFFILVSLFIGYLVIFGLPSSQPASPFHFQPIQVSQPPGEKLPPFWLAGWFLLALTSGMLGGVLASLYGLSRHSSQADFDDYFIKWYWCKPLIGALSGAVAALPFFAGLFIFNIKEGTSVMVASIATVSIIAGFCERFFLKLIERVGEVVLGPGDTSKTEAK
jgi:hypothetical protein